MPKEEFLQLILIRDNDIMVYKKLNVSRYYITKQQELAWQQLSVKMKPGVRIYEVKRMVYEL